VRVERPACLGGRLYAGDIRQLTDASQRNGQASPGSCRPAGTCPQQSGQREC
jgi:hypothetical protein